MLPCRPSFAACALLFLAGPALANTPREDLLRRVPDDVGFCLVVQDARGKLRSLAASPFALKLRESAGAKALAASDEWRRLRQAEQYLEKHLGQTANQLLDDVFGDAFAFAYRPGPPAKPEEEQGLFLLRARDEKVLAALVGRLNELQRQTGELKALEEVEHKGSKYFRRREANTTTYYQLSGPVLLFSGQELLLRDAVERGSRSATNSLLLRRMRELKLDDAFVGFLVNPRAWDAAVLANRPDDAASRLWKSLGGVGLGLHLDGDVRLRLSVQMKHEALPASLRRVLAEAAKPSGLWARVPDEPLLAVAGRIDLMSLYSFLGECMPKAARQAMEAELDTKISAFLGRDLLKEVLPTLGPDWGFWMTAPPAGGKVWTPSATAAVRLGSPKPGDSEETVEGAVLAALTAAARGVILAHNTRNPDRPIRLQVRGRWRSVVGDAALPPGVVPSIGLEGGYLLFGTSPSLAQEASVARSEGVPLLRASLKSWRAYLTERREPLAEAMAGKGVSREAVLAKIDEVRTAIELFDRVELRQEAAAGVASFTLTLTPAAAMKAR